MNHVLVSLRQESQIHSFANTANLSESMTLFVDLKSFITWLLYNSDHLCICTYNHLVIMTSLVFFGAGASKPFGIPTMQEMVVGFEETLKNDEKIFNFYSEIKNFLISKYDNSNIDIESILSVINGIATITKPEQLGYFVHYHIHQNYKLHEFPSKYIELAQKLKKQLQNYVKNVCKHNMEEDQTNTIYKKSYVSLFKHIPGEKRDYAGVNLTHDWKAYTTNYDSIFEDFWDSLDKSEDHFKKIDNSDIQVFDTVPISTIHTFSKLHGSINWVKETNTDRIIKKTHSVYTPNKIHGNVLLFPIQQKDLYLHPWFTLFQDLRMGISSKNRWFIIGYAFNDEFIKNVFEESLISDVNRKLIIINPCAEQIYNKFPDSIQKQIDILPIKFGDDFFELQFEDYINKRKTIIIRLDNTDELRIESNKHVQTAKILNDDIQVEQSNVDKYGKTNNNSARSIFFKIKNPNNSEVRLELKINYIYGDIIELRISDNTTKLNFGLDYASLPIASSHDLRDGYETKNSVTWPKDIIKLDKTKLYRISK